MELFDYQERALKDPRKKLIYWLSTGSGKSIILIERIRRIGQGAVLICTKGTKLQWLRYKERFALDIVVFTKEEIKKYLPTLRPYNVVVYDEIHTASMYTSGIFKALYAYVKRCKPEYILGATATPYSSTPWNIYTYYLLFGIHVSYPEWRARYFVEIDIGRGNPILKPAHNMDGELQMLLRNICYRQDVATGVEHDIWHDVQIEPVIMENYSSIHDVYKEENRHPAVMELLDMLVEPGTLIVCYYTEEVEMLKKLYGCPAVSGEYPFVQEYDDIAKYPILVVQADSATGWETPNHKNIVYFSRSFSYVNYYQSKGRISRINKYKDNYYHYIIPRYDTSLGWKTVAEKVNENLLKKQDFVCDKSTYTPSD
jgi:superfamily II DNA or RNA helicase